MDPISHFMNRLHKGAVPERILREAFSPIRYNHSRKSRYIDRSSSMNLDARINAEVIQGRVAGDLNLISGTLLTIPLVKAQKQMLDEWNVIFRFGNDVTGGRTITSAREITYGYNNNNVMGNNSNWTNYASNSSSLIRASRDVLTAATGGQVLSTAYVEIMGHNTVLLTDITPVMAYGALRCIVGHEENFGNLRQPYYHHFGNFCLLAVKSYIYNKLILDLDEGELLGGMALGKFREIVDGYADAEQMYNDEIPRMTKIMTMQDTTQMREWLKVSIGMKAKT